MLTMVFRWEVKRLIVRSAEPEAGGRSAAIRVRKGVADTCAPRDAIDC
jgi:hypothetical protein